jgi:hypothetical protein
MTNGNPTAGSAKPAGMSSLPDNGIQALARFCVIALLAVLPVLSMAQGMKDPTRPPAQFLDPAYETQDASPPDSGLQTIKRTGKRYLALLNGEWIKPGDKAGEAVVVKIEEHAVVLSYPDGRRETIGMYPDVEMRPRQAARRTAGR